MANPISKKPSRRERPRFGERRDKLAVVYKDPDFKTKFRDIWVNDDGVMIPKALAAGYIFVEDNEVVSAGSRDTAEGSTSPDSRIGMVTGKSGMKAFLMKIDRDLYEQDRKETEGEATEKFEQAIRGDAHPFSGQYRPRSSATKTTVTR